jgi:eukaryotic-like serine/threonine-protein kinase
MIEHLALGGVVRDTYTILEKLGEGAFSEVFLVRHKFLGLQAMKVFKTVSLAPTYDQFNEAFLLSKVAHPNVVRVFEANKIRTAEADRCYITMEYLGGGTLQALLINRVQLPIEKAVEVQKQICAGLSTAHEQVPPIVHRDIKPQNILVVNESSTRPQIKIADFGLAKNIDPRLRMVSANGTWLYMPPEGFLNYETPASDVYSAGLVFYQMLTGRFPFSSITYENDQQYRLALAKSRAAVPGAPSSSRKEIPAEVDSVCLRALQPDIKRRFQSAMEFLTALEALDAKPKKAFSEAQDLNSRTTAQEKARKAVEIGRQYATLNEAIEMLEEAIREEPRLQHQYGKTLSQWKSGLVL